MTPTEERVKLAGQQPVNGGDAEMEGMEISFVELLIRLLEKWKMITLAALIGTLLMGCYTFLLVKPTYTATSKLYVVDSANSLVDLSAFQMGNYMVADYREVFSNHEMHDLVREEMGHEFTYKELNRMLEITNPANTRILHIAVSAKDPQLAADMANTYAIESLDFIQERMNGNLPSLFEEAMPPEEPSAPSKAKNLILGFMAGVLIAGAIIVIQFITDDRVRNGEGVEKYLGIPTLGMMPLAQQEQTAGGQQHKKMNKKAGKGK